MNWSYDVAGRSSPAGGTSGSNREINDGISCSTTSQTFAGITRKYSWTMRFRIPMIWRQGISGWFALTSSDRRRAASPRISMTA